MKKFEPTHRIGGTLYMEFENGLYTFEEWTLAEACDYTFSDDGELLFQGQPAAGPFYSVDRNEMVDHFANL